MGSALAIGSTGEVHLADLNCFPHALHTFVQQIAKFVLAQDPCEGSLHSGLLPPVRLLIVFFAALPYAFLRAQSLSVSLVERSVITQRLAAGVQPHDKREGTISQLFSEAGCNVSTQPVNKRASNVICTLPGESASVVVVGAHYDFVRVGQGIVDDWTGTSLLPSLFEALNGIKRKHSFVFVAFAAEEEGLVGSRRYVKELDKEERTNVRAFVNLECLGLTTPKVWATRSTPALVKLFLQVANSIGVSVAGVSVDKVGDDDTHAFRDAKIPVISIHSITQEKFPILHSKADNLEAVLPEALYDTYRAVAFYLAYLDSQLQ